MKQPAYYEARCRYITQEYDMDLRPYLKDERDIKRALELFAYQPFIITDDIFTGVAATFIYDDNGGNRNYSRNQWIYQRNECDPDHFDRAFDANLRLATMYDDWVEAIAERFPGCSVVDIGCNTGHFLVQSQIRGMGPCTGVDTGFHNGRAIEFLNRIRGTEVNYLPGGYSSWTHTVAHLEPHDIVISSTVLQHVSDTLYFLDYMGKMAKKALFLFVGTAPGDDLKIWYKEANTLSTPEERPFPICFDCYVAPSRGLLMKSLEMMGFKTIITLPWSENWLPADWKGSQEAMLCIRD